jgi:hypothetical protein
MLHATCTQGNWVDSRLLMVGSQTATLTPDLSFGHNLCFKRPNGQCEPILYIYTSIVFQWYKEHFEARSFDPSNCAKDSGIHSGVQLPTWEFTWECEGSFPHTLCIPKSMWSDSQVSFLACNLATPCFGREPKARVATINMHINMHMHTLWS